MEFDIDQLPESVAGVVDVVGISAALRLVECWGGVRLYVPRKLEGDHFLVSTLGRDEADQLALWCGGMSIQVPRCLHALRAVRNVRIQRDHDQGESAALLALRYRLTERQIYAILAQVSKSKVAGPEVKRQQRLF